MSEISVYYEITPNPQSMKFVCTAQIADESMNFLTVAECARSPLARKIFSFPWAAGVFIGSHFVTITKQEWVDWEILAEPLAGLIKEHLERGEPVLVPAMTTEEVADESNDSPAVRQIKQILRDEIRPAVAMDGGDIAFHKYENGRVYLHMQGACSGCPSSAMTLKDGIESRLKEVLPEIQEVVSI